MKSERDILVEGMSKVIDIPIDILNIVIEGNKCAKEFLELEKALSLTGDIKNLKVLCRLLLLREEYGDLSRLNERDIKFIKENYNININIEASKKENLDDIDILEIFEEIRDIEEDMRLSKSLREIMKNS